MFLRIFLVLLFIPALWFGGVYMHRLSLLPNGLTAWWIVYGQEESWGLGPGGNETGFIVYSMPEKIKERLEDGALDWLNNKRVGRDGDALWQASPFASEGRWFTHPECANGQLLTPEFPNCRPLGLYMDQFGFGLTIPDKILHLAENAISQSGTYYYLQPRKLVVLIPDLSWIIVAYAG